LTFDNALRVVDTTTLKVVATVPLKVVALAAGVSVFNTATGALVATVPISSAGTIGTPLLTLDEPAGLAVFSTITAAAAHSPAWSLDVSVLRLADARVLRRIHVDSQEELSDSVPIVDTRT
jgi:hypothetical protein